MMKLIIGFSIILLSVLSACKGKKEKVEEKKEAYFPALSFIQGQVAELDSSLYPFQKIEFVDSVRTDTVDISREAVRGLASDFLNMPDISDEKLRSEYKEERLYDESLNRVILSYKPLDPDKQEIQLQQVLITPDPTGDKVKSIIIDRYVVNKDSSVQKRLLWQAGQSFQVATIRQKAGQPETTYTFKVTWNEMGQE